LSGEESDGCGQPMANFQPSVLTVIQLAGTLSQPQSILSQDSVINLINELTPELTDTEETADANKAP